MTVFKVINKGKRGSLKCKFILSAFLYKSLQQLTVSGEACCCITFFIKTRYKFLKPDSIRSPVLKVNTGSEMTKFRMTSKVSCMNRGSFSNASKNCSFSAAAGNGSCSVFDDFIFSFFWHVQSPSTTFFNFSRMAVATSSKRSFSTACMEAAGSTAATSTCPLPAS
jgi:hypothetical protein